VVLRWRSWLRHCATSRKVAGSIPDGVTGICQWLNPSGRSMALGSTQPLTEWSYQEPFLGGKSGRCVWLTTIPPSSADCLEILGTWTSWSPKGVSRPVMGQLYCLFIALRVTELPRSLLTTVDTSCYLVVLLVCYLPNASSRGIVVQHSIAVQPRHDWWCHSHVTDDTRQLNGALCLIVLVV
jgi:hypothetical protein